ncbi:MAG: AAA family ATPase [Bacteroidota bacterium]
MLWRILVSTDDGFPRKLLKQSMKERIAYFDNYTMAHPNLLKAANELMETIEEPAGASIVFVLGPTGVGKSTLLRRVSQKIIEAYQPKLKEDKGCIPIAGTEAAAPEIGNFDWKDFYIRSLEALKDPFIEKRKHTPFIHQVNRINPRETKLKLRLLLEETLRQRKPAAFYVDEAQNLGKVISGRKLQEQTDCIKSLSNLTGVQFVLVGTYELLLLRNLSAQLCRRSSEIHFPRYQAEADEDKQVFRNVVHTFQKHLPLEEEPELLDIWDFCYERSIGCVGILKDWLVRTLAGVFKKQGRKAKLTHQDLEHHAWSLDQCAVMLREAREGEEKLKGSTTETDFRRALGLEIQAKQKKVKAETGKKAKKQVGKPLPQRRAVGEVEDAG